jgi:hypothetical protein
MVIAQVKTLRTAIVVETEEEEGAVAEGEEGATEGAAEGATEGGSEETKE